ncbi:hypothetical protein niasHS_009833 [Heterodera schachtii]|uniref:Ras and EF-hand domain-containing protein n=1 Tax=Heterodera schachtii TaxID=97005 RepID=A0ABD2JAI5_HETSC
MRRKLPLFSHVWTQTSFNGMQRKMSTMECFEDEDQEVHFMMGDECADETPKLANGTYNYPRRRPKPPRLTKDQTFKDEVLQLYEELQSSGVPQIMSRFEEVVGNLCREIDQKRDENERLQHQQKAERESYNKRMAALENEIDQQLLIAEKKARDEEREKLAKEKEELKERLEREMGDLQTNIEHLQKMEKVLKKEAQKNGNQEKLKEKLEEIARENRTLKNNLAENHLEMTLIKAELVEIKSEYENRTLLMQLEQQQEQPSAAEAQQIQRDANKRLHDTNDNLRGALDQRTTAIKQMNMLHQQTSMNTFLSPYSRNDSLMSFPESPAISPHNIPTPDEDNDSGYPPRTYGAGSRATSSVSDNDLFRCASASVDTASPMPMSLDQQLIMARHFPAAVASNGTVLQEYSGPPDRTFRVVMCGDAAVGKSSIIMRIVKGIFQSNIASTLGVVFHVKSVRVGEQNIAVQLWDTAGQERFRSLCNSYFRRADGAILESTMKEVPILLVGNKVDLRNSGGDGMTNDESSSTFVSRKEGENLSELLGTDFIETSALDGTNVETALLLLVGEMLKTEDDQLKQTAMMLQNGGKSKKSKCLSCGNS